MYIKGWTDKEGSSISWPVLGMFTSPDGTAWSNMPYTKEQKTAQKQHDRMEHTIDKIIAHLKRTDRSINEELDLVKSKKSTLPAYCKKYLLGL